MKSLGLSLLTVRKTSNHSRVNPGFTIVELLVVIVVIGVLAAITIVSYTGISQKATVASLTSDLDNASKLLKMDQVINSAYPASLAVANSGKGIPASSGTTYQYVVNNNITPQSFCMSATKNSITYITTEVTTSTLGNCNNYLPVLYLDAGSTASYPGSGTTWTDLSGNGNNGTISNGEYVSLGEKSYLRNLGNISNVFVIDIPDSSTINNTFSVTTGGWTIEEAIWTNSTIYPEADAGSVASNTAFGAGATGFDWNHAMDQNNFRFGLTNNGGDPYDDSIQMNVPSPYNSLNSWKIRTMIWDRTNNKVLLYINGDYINQGNTPNTAGLTLYDGGGIHIGELYGWKHYGRRGVIKIYSRVLTSNEITQNFNSLRGRYGL